MPITEQTLTVSEGGRVALQVPRPVGTRIRVIVLEPTESLPPEADALAAMQSSTGFAFQVLGDPAEDVWNDL